MPPLPPTTDVEICNLALSRLGQTNPIESLEDPEGKLEILCAQHYPMTRRRLLRGPRVYGFAKRLATLTVSGTVVPPFGFNKAFRLPNDYLRLLTPGEIPSNGPIPPRLYDVVDGHIYTDEVDGATLKLYYIFDQVLVAKWDALFVNLMRLELARDMAYAFTLKTSMVDALNEELRDVRLEAGAVAGQEKPPVRVSRSKWLAARRLGGDGRDTTRHLI
jgi:hypothetical protein